MLRSIPEYRAQFQNTAHNSRMPRNYFDKNHHSANGFSSSSYSSSSPKGWATVEDPGAGGNGFLVLNESGPCGKGFLMLVAPAAAAADAKGLFSPVKH